MSAARNLRDLERRLHHGRAYGSSTEAEQDVLLEQMDALWPLLTPDEQAEVNERAARLAKLMSGPDLQMVDRVVRDGELPRCSSH